MEIYTFMSVLQGFLVMKTRECKHYRAVFSRIFFSLKSKADINRDRWNLLLAKDSKDISETISVKLLSWTIWFFESKKDSKITNFEPEIKVHTPFSEIRKSDELDEFQEQQEQQIFYEFDLHLTQRQTIAAFGLCNLLVYKENKISIL